MVTTHDVMNARSISTKALLAIAAVIAAGCQHQKPEPGKMVAAGKVPPRVPATVATPIDPVLHQHALDEVSSALHSSQDVERAHAIESVQDAAPPNAGATIVSALSDRSPLVKKAAALAAGELRVRSATGSLNDIVQQTEGATDRGHLAERMAAIFALHRLGDTSHSHLFEKTAFDPDQYIRGDTALILGMLGDRSAIPLLLKMTQRDSDALDRLQAAEALWRLGDERGLDELIGGTISGYPDDRMVAVTALAEPKDTRILGHVEGMLTDDYPEVALVAARAAGVLGSDEGYGVALRGAASVDPRRRALAALAFGTIGRTDAQPVLSRLLRDDRPEVRLAAAEAILQIDSRH